MYAGVLAKIRANQPAFIMAQTGVAVTYAELEQRTNRLAHFLRSRGLKRLDHYAIFMENNDRYVESCGAGERAAKADVALIISTALPKGVESFDLVDGVYVAHPRCAVPVALTLRQGLLEIANARATQAGQQSKAEQVYQYLTGPRFKQRIEAIVE